MNNDYIMLNLYSLFILFVLFFVFFNKKRAHQVEDNTYAVILISMLMVIIIGLMSSLLFYVDISRQILLITLCSKLYLIGLFVVFVIFTYYSYIVSQFKNKNIRLLNRIFVIIASILSIIILVLPLSVTLVDNGVMITGASGEFSYLLYGLCYLIIISMMVIAHKRLKSKKYIPMFLLIIGGFIILLAQVFVENINFLTNPFMVIIVLVMYFTIENPDVKMINELELAKNTAEKANRAKSDFLSSMSHEIRTPLNAIVGLSEIIKNSNDLDEIHEDASDVVMASQNLLEIVNGILDISKIEADKMEIVETNYNPIQIFNELATLIKTRIGEKEIELRCNFAPDIPTNLYGDKVKLKQIISNILTNAVKYTEKGYIDFNVSCINEKNSCRLQISVADTGKGIKPEQIDKIFNKFERSEEDKNSTIEGTGLGLAITKALLEMMGGKIVVHSTYQEGSKFTVFLEQKLSKEIESIKEENQEKISYNNKSALIVDDNKLNLKVASKILNEFELNVESVENGFLAIEKIENKNYDIIFLDIMMPKIDGIETLKKLKQIENFNTPVVALTADAMEGKASKYIEEGFNDYLSKPIEKQELKRVLDKCLNDHFENVTLKEDPHIHDVIPITDEDIEKLEKLKSS